MKYKPNNNTRAAIALLWRIGDGCTYAEIAKRLGVSRSNAARIVELGARNAQFYVRTAYTPAIRRLRRAGASPQGFWIKDLLDPTYTGAPGGDEP